MSGTMTETGLQIVSGDDATAAAAFAAQFQARRDSLPGGGLDWLSALREAGMAEISAHGLPTPRVEDWKYTNLRPLDKLAFAPAERDEAQTSLDLVPSLLAEGDSHPRLVFVNGFLRPDLSRLEALPDGVLLGGLATLLAEQPALLADSLSEAESFDGSPLTALNTALMEDGAVLKVARGVTLEQPIELVFLAVAEAQPLSVHPRNLIVMEEASAATVIELHASLGEGTVLSNHASDVRLAQGAHLTHVKLQDENPQSYHLASLRARLDRDTTYSGFGLALGAALSRNEARVRLEGDGGHCLLGGGYLMRDQQHCDNTTVIEHLAPHTSCREVFKGALDDKARGVFQGKIVVHRDAQQINGHQLSKALLLSDEAEMDAKPELEIYADDVQCSHGATAGEIDHDALFYLRSRGVPEKRARSLLIQAFLAEAVEEVAPEALHEALNVRITAWLGARRQD